MNHKQATQDRNRANAVDTMGSIVLAKYLGQILREAEVWLDLGGIGEPEGSSPTFAPTLPPSLPYIIALSHEECWVTSFAIECIDWWCIVLIPSNRMR